MKNLIKLYPELKSHKKTILISLFFSLLLGGISVLPLKLIKELQDQVLVDKDLSRLKWITLSLIGLYLVNFIVRFISFYFMRVTVIRINESLKNKIFHHVMNLSADYFSSKSVGGLISRMGDDPNKIDQGLEQLAVLIREPVKLILLIGYLLWLNWKMTLLTFVILPPLFYVFSYTGKYVKRYIQKTQDEQASLFGSLQEALSGIKMIKAFRLEEEVNRKFQMKSSSFALNLIKTSRLQEFSHPLVELLTSFAVAIIIYVGGSSVIQNEMSQGEFLAFFVAFAMITAPIRVLNEMMVKLSTADGAAGRVFEILDWKSSIEESPQAQALPRFESQIEFKNVSFAYPDEANRIILHSLNLTIHKGQNIALVGPSGSGKSSLVTLLPRIFEPTLGQILIDGRPLKEIQVQSLRNLISTVSQDVFLFHDTIYENIRAGKLNATKEEILEASRKANAYDFIMSLPQQFETSIGDRGQKLSGGERQRISIARAFLRDTPILILDEATSSLDQISEKAVQSALETLMKHKTCITIAHRLSTIRHAERIYVLHSGAIKEQGTHEELIRLQGEYYKLSQVSEGE